MVIESTLLKKAKDAGAELQEAERQAVVAQAEYHTAIRRLHLGGASLREIGDALSLSHQRVQQIVSAAGGSWWRAWKRRNVKPDAVCTWCDKPPSEVSKLIAGPTVFICDSCIRDAERAIGTAKRGSKARCSFCQKRSDDKRTVLTGPANVCSECLGMCREIVNSRG